MKLYANVRSLNLVMTKSSFNSYLPFSSNKSRNEELLCLVSYLTFSDQTIREKKHEFIRSKTKIDKEISEVSKRFFGTGPITKMYHLVDFKKVTLSQTFSKTMCRLLLGWWRYYRQFEYEEELRGKRLYGRVRLIFWECQKVRLWYDGKAISPVEPEWWLLRIGPDPFQIF